MPQARLNIFIFAFLTCIYCQQSYGAQAALPRVRSQSKFLYKTEPLTPTPAAPPSAARSNDEEIDTIDFYVQDPFGNSLESPRYLGSVVVVLSAAKHKHRRSSSSPIVLGSPKKESEVPNK